MAEADPPRGRLAQYRKTAYIRVCYVSPYRRHKQDKNELQELFSLLTAGTVSTLLTAFQVDHLRVELITTSKRVNAFTVEESKAVE